MIKKNILKIVLVTMASSAIGFKSFSATYFVSTTGSDAVGTPGTKDRPFKTIVRGSRELAAGDTLYIRKGTYNEAMSMYADSRFKFVNGTATTPTLYAAYPGEERQVIVRPPEALKSLFVVYFHRTNAFIKIRGLVLDATYATNYVIKLDGNRIKNSDGSQKWGEHAHEIQIINNVIKNGKGSGIGGGGDCKIVGNEIFGMRTYGIYTAFNNGVIENNTFHENGGFGIHLYDTYISVNNWIIRGNRFYRNGTGYLKSTPTGSVWRTGAAAVIISRGRFNQFYNNILYDNKQEAVSVWGGGHDTLVANNTVYGNGQGIVVYAGIQRARIINNISFGNKSDPQIDDDGTGTELKGNLTVDPKVVNLTGRDFRLRSDSVAAINKGIPLLQVKTDFLGVARPQGGAFDIGAYEYRANAFSVPLAPMGLALK